MQSSNTDKKENLLFILLILQITVHSVNEDDRQRWAKFDETHWFPLQPIQDVEEVAKLPEQFKMQNAHPQLVLYDATINAGHTSHDEFQLQMHKTAPIKK